MGIEETVLTTLLDLGGIGILAGFLMWIHVQNTRRLDAMQSKHDKLLSDWKQERVSVVERLIDETHTVNINLSEVKNVLDSTIEKLDTGLTEMRRHYTEQDVEKRIRKLSD